jgi:hypothetical protein
MVKDFATRCNAVSRLYLDLLSAPFLSVTLPKLGIHVTVPARATSTTNLILFYLIVLITLCRSQWRRGLRHELSSLARNTGMVGSNPTQSLDVCLRLFCLSCPV